MARDEGKGSGAPFPRFIDQRLATYIVTSKPKRRSEKVGVVHFMLFPSLGYYSG